MKKNQLLKIILLIIVGLTILSFAFPTDITSEASRKYLGVWNVFSYMTMLLSYFGHYFLYILTVGAFYGILNVTGVYGKMVEELSTKFKKNRLIFTLSVFAIFSILASVTSAALALFVLFPLFISVILKLGYDKLTAFTATFGALLIGSLAPIFNSDRLNILFQMTSETYDKNLLYRLIMFVLVTVATGVGLYLYIKSDESSKNNKKPLFKKDKESNNQDLLSYEKGTKKVRGLGGYITLGVIALFLIVASFPWNSFFKIDIFSKLTTEMSKVNINGFKVFDNILALPEIGSYTLMSYFVIIVIAMIVLGFVYKINIDNFFENAGKGAVKFLRPAFMVVLVNAVVFIAANHEAYMFFVNLILKGHETFNLLVVSGASAVISLIGVDYSFAMQIGFQSFSATLTDTTIYPSVGLVLSSIHGLISLIVPTSLVLVLGLSYLDIKYTTWVKFFYKIFVVIFIIVLGTLILAVR